MCMGCNQRKLAIDNVRISKAEDSTDILINILPFWISQSVLFFLPKLILMSKGKRFETMNEIKQYALKQMMAIPKAECFEKWKKYWNKCIKSQEVYFEED